MTIENAVKSGTIRETYYLCMELITKTHPVTYLSSIWGLWHLLFSHSSSTPIIAKKQQQTNKLF